jgi:hypothetical protein
VIYRLGFKTIALVDNAAFKGNGTTFTDMAFKINTSDVGSTWKCQAGYSIGLVTERLQVQIPDLPRYKICRSAPEQAVNPLFLGRL